MIESSLSCCCVYQTKCRQRLLPSLLFHRTQPVLTSHSHEGSVAVATQCETWVHQCHYASSLLKMLAEVNKTRGLVGLWWAAGTDIYVGYDSITTIVDLELLVNCHCGSLKRRCLVFWFLSHLLFSSLCLAVSWRCGYVFLKEVDDVLREEGFADTCSIQLKSVCFYLSIISSPSHFRYLVTL